MPTAAPNASQRPVGDAQALPPPPPGYQYVRLQPEKSPSKPRNPPLELPYEDGDPVPPGYRVAESPRHGLVTAGYILTAIPYGIGVMVALSADFKNKTGYLLVPFVGPWLTIGRRSYFDCSNERNEDGTVRSSTSEGLGCAADVLVVLGLSFDGIMQASGGAMLLAGYLSTRKKLVRTDFSWSIRPQAIGTGYGIGAVGTF